MGFRVWGSILGGYGLDVYILVLGGLGVGALEFGA